jgi:hypothetical protein
MPKVKTASTTKKKPYTIFGNSYLPQAYGHHVRKCEWEHVSQREYEEVANRWHTELAGAYILHP